MTSATELALRSVQEFNRCINTRDLPGAKALAGTPLTLTFPGDLVFTDLDTLFAWLGSRFKQATFAVAHHDAVPDSGVVRIYAQGLMHGALADGFEFAGVRFIDRYWVQDGKIIAKEAWSDMGDLLRQRALQAR